MPRYLSLTQDVFSLPGSEMFSRLLHVYCENPYSHMNYRTQNLNSDIFCENRVTNRQAYIQTYIHAYKYKYEWYCSSLFSNLLNFHTVSYGTVYYTVYNGWFKYLIQVVKTQKGRDKGWVANIVWNGAVSITLHAPFWTVSSSKLSNTHTVMSIVLFTSSQLFLLTSSLRTFILLLSFVNFTFS